MLVQTSFFKKISIPRSSEICRNRWNSIGNWFLAGVAGAVAFDTMFGPKILAGEQIEKLSIWEENFWIFNLLFGIIWGLIIFNLDRFIVSSTGKGDGTDEVTFKEIRQALPRIGIALILGFTISKPLEIKMLKSEIDVELSKTQEKSELNLIS